MTRESEKYFRIFFSTKRLLRYAMESDIIHTDGTYQLVVQGYPVLVVGISDADKCFHMSGLAVTAGETSADYKFVFDSLKHGVEIVTNEKWYASKLVADMTIAITQGYTQSTEGAEFTRIHCYSHLMSNVEKQKFNSAENK